MPVLSVIIPVYNEIDTIGNVLSQVAGALPQTSKQIVVVDDCSSDGTAQWLRRNIAEGEAVFNSVTLGEDGNLDLRPCTTGNRADVSLAAFFHSRNQGKGAAVRTGLAQASGDVIVIQDADLEYDPNDWARMLPLITERKVADVVYGSRFTGEAHRALYFHHYMGNRLITFLFNMFYNQMLSDIEVCYKMFTRDVLHGFNLTSDDFGLEIEISAQIALARRWRIYEVGISYYGRTYSEGKKITWRDGVKAILYLFKFRLRRL